MKGNHFDPVDHYHTTDPHGGVAFKSVLALPVLILIVGGVVVAVSALAAAGYMRPQWAALLGVAAILIGIVGTAVVVMEHRRTRRDEARWLAESRNKSGTT